MKTKPIINPERSVAFFSNCKHCYWQIKWITNWSDKGLIFFSFLCIWAESKWYWLNPPTTHVIKLQGFTRCESNGIKFMLKKTDNELLYPKCIFPHNSSVSIQGTYLPVKAATDWTNPPSVCWEYFLGIIFTIEFVLFYFFFYKPIVK